MQWRAEGLSDARRDGDKLGNFWVIGWARRDILRVEVARNGSEQQ
jgi:hypothetical protein